jgi:hypothetical protein
LMRINFVFRPFIAAICRRDRRQMVCHCGYSPSCFDEQLPSGYGRSILPSVAAEGVALGGLTKGQWSRFIVPGLGGQPSPD